MKNKEIWLLSLLASVVLVIQVWSILHIPKPTIKLDRVFQEDIIKQQPKRKIVAKETVLVKAVLHRLELELLGTAIGNIKDPIAFIKDLKTGKQGTYRLGNQIQGARIVKINVGEVYFEINGQQQALRLSSRGRAWCKIDQRYLPILSVSGNEIVVSKAGALNKAGDICKTLSSVKVKPYYQSDEVAGLMIDGIEQGSIIEEAGIRNNDIINTVNEQRIDSYQKALQVFKKVRNQEEIRVGLLRDGQKKLLCYRIDE